MLATDMKAQITTPLQIHHQVETIPVLEGVTHVHNKGVLQDAQQVIFIADRFVTLLG